MYYVNPDYSSIVIDSGITARMIIESIHEGANYLNK